MKNRYLFYGNILSIPKCETLLDETNNEDTCDIDYDDKPIKDQPKIEEFYKKNYCNIFSYLMKIHYRTDEYNISKEAALVYLYYWIYIKHTNKARTYKIYDVFKAFLSGYEDLYRTQAYKDYINNVISDEELKNLEAVFDVYMCLNKIKGHKENGYCDTLINIINQYNTEIESNSGKMDSNKIQAYNRSYNVASIIITVVIMMVVFFLLLIFYQFSSYGYCIRRRINNIRKKWIHADKEWNILQSPESFDSIPWNNNYNVI
ncbi:variable surface protein [Plasmodium gonderi]|uniref:Variable surface protein n=1 Tax=Plasmodium gonderi TaxID=77519 RepID=A0A1Y1JRV5_PLAGO|nr:variable surface protein [Plasmodium gonderi]GAW84205.1 variable surface protein [Plasmodium gonderi]